MSRPTLTFPTPQRAAEWLFDTNERHMWANPSPEVCEQLIDGLRLLNAIHEPTAFYPQVGLRLPAYLPSARHTAG